VKVQDKFLKTSNKATLGEIYIQNHILAIKNLFKMSAVIFTNFNGNNLLSLHFNQYFKFIQTIRKYSISLATSKNFSQRVIFSQDQCYLKFIGTTVAYMAR